LATHQRHSRFTLSVLSFSLAAGSIFYLIYPFLFAVTPPEVFGNPFGFYHITSVAGAFPIVPLGLVWRSSGTGRRDLWAVPTPG
jgi:hypothetical protein